MHAEQYYSHVMHVRTAGPIMEVTELEELEEEEEHRLSSAALSTLSQEDRAEFLEQEKEEGEGMEAATLPPLGIERPQAGGGGDHGNKGNIGGASCSGNTTTMAGATPTLPGKPTSSFIVPQVSPSLNNLTGVQIMPQDSTTSFPLLELRLHSSSSSRRKYLGQMRLASGMSAQVTLQPPGPGGSWDHEQLTKRQFAALVEQFLCSEPEQSLVDSVLHYITENYTETLEVGLVGVVMCLSYCMANRYSCVSTQLASQYTCMYHV